MIRASFVLLAALLPSWLLADTVELSGGGHVTGKVTRLPDGKGVIVQIDDELRIAFSETRVRRVVVEDQLAQYRALAEAAGEDAEKHYELGIWCVKAENFPGDSDHYKRYHMQRAIELDPEHSAARAQLEFIKEDGQWIKQSDLMRKRGLVRTSGGFKLPEVVLHERLMDEADRKAKLWVKEINRLIPVILRGKGDVAAATAELKAIQDPLAAEAVADELKDSRGKRTQPRELRLLWVKLLGRFHNRTSVEALVLAGIDEPDAEVREAAIAELQSYGAGSAVATYLPMLKSNDNKIINSAARALSHFIDPELALTYTEALVTTHTEERLSSSPGSTNAGFTPDGGGGFSTGSKKVVVKRDLQNPAVLGLLTSLEPDVNYGYDETKWRDHFAAKLTNYEGDLRRDP